MAIITVRGVDEQTKEMVRAKAKQNGRSLEAEVRQIITSSVRIKDPCGQPDATLDIGSQIQSIFKGTGDGLDLPLRTDYQREINV